MYAIKEGENKYNVNIFTQGDNNIANLNQKMSMDSGIYNTLYTENLWQLFLYSIPASITNTTFDGKECYYIANFRNPYTECQAGTYIDKETGLSLSTIAYEFEDMNGIVERYPATEHTYEFGTVTEKDFEEPNLSDYKVE